MKVLVYPRDDNNPYQKLLYGALREGFDVEVSYVRNSRITLLFFPFYLLIKRLQGFTVFHLHWPNFYVAKSYPKAAFLSFLLSKYCLAAIRVAHLSLVWTIHNVVPHETKTSNDLAIAKYIAEHAAVNIVHSNSGIADITSRGIEASRVEVIPHGNYAGVYSDTISRSEARKRLNIDSGAFAILFFGLIRAYKGIDDLLAAYAAIETPATRLIIAGNSQDATLTKQIVDAQKSLRLDYYPGYVPDEAVAMYFKACDVVCLPFKSITTSGSALLAITFGKPLVAPLTGALLDIPTNTGYFYNPHDTHGLQSSLLQAANDKRGQNSKRKAANAYAKTLNWDSIATKTFAVYKTASAGKVSL